MLNSNTKRKINNARDILVGKIPMPTTQVEQITLALIYKFMADMDKRSKALGDTSGFFANGYEKYSWEKLMDKAIPARDRVKLYGEGLEKMSTNPHIPQLFRNIFKNAFLPFNDPEVLKLFLDQIDQFDYEHSEELGNAFEYLLSSMSSQGDAGQFRTPRHIIDFIVKVVDPKKTDRILDPACGTAGFLISAYKHLVVNGLKNDELKNVSKNFVGYDISHDMVRLSLVNLYLHHFPDPHVYEYDTLTSEDRWDDDFDVILANPPFMTPKGGMKTHSKFSIPSKKAEVLFTDYIMEHLSTNGKAGVIVPEGIIFQSQNAYKKLRKMMIEDNYLWAVISLPSGVFNPYSGVKTSILLFDKILAKKTSKVLFVKIENDGYDLGAQRRQIKKDDLPQALEVLKNFKEAINNDKDLKIKGDDFFHSVEKLKIKESGDWNLSGERYKEKIKTKSSNFEMVKLNKITEIKKGSSITKKKAIPGEYPVIAGGKNHLYTHNKFNRSAKVITISASGANAGFINYFEKPIFASDCTTIEAQNQEVDTKFLYYLLKAKQNYFYSLQQGGAQPHVYKKDFEILKVPLPSLSIQQKILEELNRYEKIIDGAKQVIDNYNPEFEIEKDWEWIKIEKLCDVKGGKRIPKGLTLSNDKTDYPYIRVSDFDNFSVNRSNLKYIDKVIHEKIKKYTISSNDVYISIAGTIGLSGIIPKDLDGSNLTENAAKIVIKQKLNKYYLTFVLNHKTIQNQIKKSTLGVGVPKLALKRILDLDIPLPPEDIQQKIVSRIKEEQEIIKANIILIEIFEEKIRKKISKVWGE